MNKDELNEEKFCKYCEKAKSVTDGDTMLCSKHGIVSAGYCCRRFRYDPLKRSPKHFLKEIKLEYVDV